MHAYLATTHRAYTSLRVALLVALPRVQYHDNTTRATNPPRTGTGGRGDTWSSAESTKTKTKHTSNLFTHIQKQPPTPGLMHLHFYFVCISVCLSALMAGPNRASYTPRTYQPVSPTYSLLIGADARRKGDTSVAWAADAREDTSVG